MNLINTLFGIPLGYLMFACYTLCQNYGLTIILFTLLSKLILLPVSLVVQKNSIKMVKLQPEMDEIQRRYAGDKERIGEEQMKLYDREGYNPAFGCLPLLLQIPIVLGLITVIYNPLQHLFHLNGETISAMIDKAGELLGAPLSGSGIQLKVIDLIGESGNSQAFSNIEGLTTAILEKIKVLDLNFLGINLGAVPSLGDHSLLLLIPIFAGLSTLAMCMYQDRANVLQREQSLWNKWGLTIFNVAFTMYFVFLVPAGVGLYWIFSNLFAILLQFVLNKIYDPKKYIDYSQRETAPVISAEEKRRQKELSDKYASREKEDYKRFFTKDNADKQIVFYSEQSGFYKYYADIIRQLLDTSEIVIHYVTSDPDDKIFSIGEPRIKPYYIGNDSRLITLFMKIETKIFAMTVPDIERYHLKRSKVDHSVEYLYIAHGVGSNNLLLREGALDHYDTIMCTGPAQVSEIREREALYEMKKKRLVMAGYPLLDDLISSYESAEQKKNERPQILIAPSWQVDNIIDLCLDAILDQLIGTEYSVIVRPHPQQVRHEQERFEQLKKKYQENGSNILIQTDFSSNETIYNSDLLITDWSDISFEFAFTTLKPVLLINTPMKIMNPKYQEIQTVPDNIALRSVIGKNLEVEQIASVKSAIDELLADTDVWAAQIKQARQEHVYNIGSSAAIEAKYILNQLRYQKSNK